MTGAPDRGDPGASPDDDLLVDLADRVHRAPDEHERLRLLLDVVVAIAADQTLTDVLGRVVRIARVLAGARYAALGVLGHGPGRRLATFVHDGMDPHEVARIGDLPSGAGLLGHIIDDPQAVRLHDISLHPASSGLPANHPPMRTFLGVPVRVRETVFGNLYLAEKEDGSDFSPQDEDVVRALAVAAGVAVESARLHDEARRRERWLGATAEITEHLVGATGGEEALQLIADRALAAADADVAWIVTTTDAGTLEVRVVAGSTASSAALRALPALPLVRSLAAEVVRSGEPASSVGLGTDTRDVDMVARLGWPSLGPTVIVPLRASRGIEGALSLSWSPRRAEAFHVLDPLLPASFAEHAALALEVARANETRQRLAILEDRLRIGRDLHDVVVQRLFGVCLSLDSVASQSGDASLNARVSTAVDELDDTIRDIRRTIFALRTTDDDGDLQTEVLRIVERARRATGLDVDVVLEGPVRSLALPDVARDLLAVLTEALSNATRHGGASHVDVLVRAGTSIMLVVSDDGRGLRGAVTESGVANMRERARRHGGTVTLAPGQHGGAVLTWVVPAL